LFSIKFMWKKPNTWFRSIRYLDPMQATVEGELLPTDIVVARRMSFSSDAGFADDGEIAMGEM
jgi:hypothetical protein